MINLRPYQQKAITSIKEQWQRSKKRLCLSAPTGSGKTVIFCDLAKKVTDNGKKVLIFTNRTELLTQAGGSLQKVGLKSFAIKAGTNFVSKNHHAFVAMAQTVRNRLTQPEWIAFFRTIDLFIIDECHLCEFDFLFEHETLFDGKFVLGFTATPNRSGKMTQLGSQYEELLETVTVKQLIAEGYLNDCDYYGCSSPDLSNVGYDKMKGDYKDKDLFKSFNQGKLYAGVVRNWQTIAANTKTLVFCCNIEHTIKTCQEFNDNGIKAKFLVSYVSRPKYPTKTDEGSIVIYNEKLAQYNLYCKAMISMSGERDAVLSQFNNGEFDVLVNAGILTTGYDEPSIETIIINRATMSISLWLQMLGRGSRLFEGKTHFNVLDFGDNAKTLGTYSEDRNWNLWHQESKGGGVAPVKRCGFTSKDVPIYPENCKERLDMFNTLKLDGCGRYIHAGLTICPWCGFKSPEKILKEVDLETIFFDSQKMLFERAKPISQMNDVELADYCKQKGHKQAWLWRKLYYKGGTQLIDLQPWTIETKEKAKKYCENYCN